MRIERTQQSARQQTGEHSVAIRLSAQAPVNRQL